MDDIKVRVIDSKKLIEAINAGSYEINLSAVMALGAMMTQSAQPERKKGKWIPHNEKTREYIGTVLVNVEYEYWLCDSCGYRVNNGQPLYNFCPNCGVDMRGNDHETN